MISSTNIRLSTEHRTDGITHVKVGGKINIYSAERLKKHLLELASKKSSHFIVDLNETMYIDSSGIGALITLSSMYNNNQTRIRFVNIPGNIRKIIQLSGVVSLIPQCTSIDEAVIEIKQIT
ncbi:MAG: STAS domain-containing protein [Spirochaetales bacterium]|nr:STAS domain-containing protein [Spirochaetales bacterium]